MATTEMDTLIDRTSGLQPWRRVFHASSGTLLALALTFVAVPRSVLVGTLTAALLLQGAADLVRMRAPWANALFFRACRYLASPRDATGLASSTWYTFGILVAVAFFPLEAAVSGILVLALADPIGSYIGRRWGKRHFLGATAEGSLVVGVTAFAILAVRHGPLTAVVGALVATLVERLSWPLDDNLTLPIATAAAVTLSGALL